MLVKRAKIDGLCAAIPRGAELVCDQLVRHQCLHAGGFDVVDMHKNIGAAAIGRDKAISAIRVEEFDPPSWHAINPIQRTARAPTRRRDVPEHGTTRCSRPGRPLSAPSCQYEFYRKTPSADMGRLILKRANCSRSSGQWKDDDYDVIADGVAVGRIFNAGRYAVNVDVALWLS